MVDTRVRLDCDIDELLHLLGDLGAMGAGAAEPGLLDTSSRKCDNTGAALMDLDSKGQRVGSTPIRWNGKVSMNGPTVTDRSS